VLGGGLHHLDVLAGGVELLRGLVPDALEVVAVGRVDVADALGVDALVGLDALADVALPLVGLQRRVVGLCLLGLGGRLRRGLLLGRLLGLVGRSRGSGLGRLLRLERRRVGLAQLGLGLGGLARGRRGGGRGARRLLGADARAVGRERAGLVCLQEELKGRHDLGLRGLDLGRELPGVAQQPADLRRRRARELLAALGQRRVEGRHGRLDGLADGPAGHDEPVGLALGLVLIRGRLGLLGRLGGLLALQGRDAVGVGAALGLQGRDALLQVLNRHGHL